MCRSPLPAPTPRSRGNDPSSVNLSGEACLATKHALLAGTRGPRRCCSMPCHAMPCKSKHARQVANARRDGSRRASQTRSRKQGIGAAYHYVCTQGAYSTVLVLKAAQTASCSRTCELVPCLTHVGRQHPYLPLPRAPCSGRASTVTRFARSNCLPTYCTRSGQLTHRIRSITPPLPARMGALGSFGPAAARLPIGDSPCLLRCLSVVGTCENSVGQSWKTASCPCRPLMVPLVRPNAVHRRRSASH